MKIRVTKAKPVVEIDKISMNTLLAAMTIIDKIINECAYETDEEFDAEQIIDEVMNYDNNDEGCFFNFKVIEDELNVPVVETQVKHVKKS